MSASDDGEDSAHSTAFLDKLRAAAHVDEVLALGATLKDSAAEFVEAELEKLHGFYEARLREVKQAAALLPEGEGEGEVDLTLGSSFVVIHRAESQDVGEAVITTQPADDMPAPAAPAAPPGTPPPPSSLHPPPTAFEFLSTPSPVSHQFSFLINRPYYVETLKNEALAGQLLHVSVRSICWRLFLELLPENKDEWKPAVTVARSIYERDRQELIVDPRKANENVDLRVHNPLSLEEDSPWQQYFHDQELRQTIEQDVNRTFPELELFRSSAVQQDLSDILFCYAKRYSTFGYRQGMHELLATAYLVVEREALDASQHIPGESSLTQADRDLMVFMLSREHVAHDASTLFHKVMSVTYKWFEPSAESASFSRVQSKAGDIFSAPFQKRKEEPEERSAIHNKLLRIQEILNSHEAILYSRLQNLGIPAQIYGLRWLRVLFGREFHLENTLMLWDTLFADSPRLDLADYVCVSMLCYIRDDLLRGDYSDCLRRLMKFPPVGDVRFIVEQALHIRDPEHFPPPPNERETLVLTEAPPVPQASSTRPSAAAVPAKPAAKAPPQTASKPQFDPFESSTSKPSSHAAPAASSVKREEKKHEPSTPSGSGFHLPKQLLGSHSSSKHPSAEKQLQSRVDDLEERLTAIQQVNKIYGERLSGFIDQALAAFSADKPDEDGFLVAIAGMKETRDVLRGAIKPNLDHDEELALGDKVIDISYKDFGKIEVFSPQARADPAGSGVISSIDVAVAARLNSDSDETSSSAAAAAVEAADDPLTAASAAESGP
eukprot:m.757957 g.757957  ORF g.757957 m.757957 type:complete len:778 (-) comp59028_c0_seq3:71-2404(-)